MNTYEDFRQHVTVTITPELRAFLQQHNIEVDTQIDNAVRMIYNGLVQPLVLNSGL